MWQFRVDVKLPVWHKQKQDFAIREREASELESEAGADAIRRSLESGIQQEYAAAVTARKLISLYDDSVIPQSKLALESSLVAYRAGSLDFLALFSNFMTTVDYELMYHEEIMRLHLAKARLEELSGREL
jgi:outer membrane protein TolC